MVALDGYRVALKKIKLDYPGDFENTEYIIPKRSLLEWSRIVSDESKTSLYRNENDLMFVSDDTTMLCLSLIHIFFCWDAFFSFDFFRSFLDVVVFFHCF